MVDGDFSFKFKLPNTGYTLSGYSKNKTGTGLFIDDLSLGLDCGSLKTDSIPKHIFLTRNDLEVFMYAPMLIHLTQLTNEKTKITFHVPEAYSRLLDRMISKALALGSIGDPSDKRGMWEIDPVRHGSNISIENNCFVQAFETTRSSVGYAFYGCCRRLRKEYSGYGFRDANTQSINRITEKATYPLFVYTGSVPPVVFRRPDVAAFLKPFKNIITECPYIEQWNADPGKTSLEALLPVIKSSPDTIFVLTRLEHAKSYEELKQIQLDSPPNVLFAMSQECNTSTKH